MKELLEHIIESIVNNPDEVSVDEKESVDFPGLTILTVDVSEEDKGIVIGRRGRTINAIRDLITINAIRNDRRVKVLIKDDERKRSQDTPTEENNNSQTQDSSEENMLIDDGF